MVGCNSRPALLLDKLPMQLTRVFAIAIAVLQSLPSSCMARLGRPRHRLKLTLPY